MKITEYVHEDAYGARFSITSFAGGALTIRLVSDDGAVELNRAAVAGLKAFLTGWEERTTPAPQPRPGITNDVVSILAEALSKPLTARSPVEPLCHRPSPEGAHHASRCTWCGHLWITHRMPDPEPREVGHPEEPAELCECGHPRELHGAMHGGCTLCECALGRLRTTRVQP